MRIVSRLVAIVVLAGFCPACSRPASEDSQPVATWDGGTISRADYESWRRFHDLEDSPEALHEIAYVLSMAAATRARGGDRELGTKLELEATRHRVLVSALKSHETAAIEISDDELESLRLEHPDAFSRPRKLRLRNIYRRLGSGSEAEATRAHMAEIHRQLAAGASFEELARRESQSQTRLRGGKLGYVALDKLPPEVAAALRDLQPGQLSEPVEHGDGVTIFLCEDIRDAKIPDAAEVREKLRANLTRQRANEGWRRAQETWLEEASPQISPRAESVLSMEGYVLDRAALAELVAKRRPGATPAEFSEEELTAFLRSWATDVVCARRASELGLDQEPETAASLRWRELAALAHSELVRRIDERPEEPDEETLRSHFDANRSRYVVLPAYQLAAIHFGDGTAPDEVEQARRVVGELEDGEISFEAAAKAYSVDPSATDGGLLGWLDARQVADFGPTAFKAVKELHPGQRSGLLRFQSGLWIFELQAAREIRSMDFDEARPQLRDEVRRMRIRELEAVVRDEQLASLDLQILVVPDGHSDGLMTPDAGTPVDEAGS